MSQFTHCHPSGNMMWCQHHNGSWISFPIARDKKEEVVEKEIATTSKEE